MKTLLKMVCSAVTMLAVSKGAHAQTTKQTTLSAKKGDFHEQGRTLADSTERLGWNVNGSFLFWYTSQGAMDLAAVYPDDVYKGEVINQSSKFQPGFKVGVGYDTKFDQWAVNAEYTRFHAKSFTAASKENLWPSTFFPVGFGGNGPANYVEGKWKLHLDMIDLVAGRPLYQETNVTISPAGGIRALLLRQSLNVDILNNGAAHGSSHNASRSWAVGPKAGMNTKWMLGKGFRIDSAIGTSLLFTRYTILSNEEVYRTGQSTWGSSSAANRNLNALRSTLELGLGLGFASFAMDNKLFIDVSARYDFAQYWSQNMMRSYSSQLAAFSAQGDLAMHGLTLNVGCDF